MTKIIFYIILFLFLMTFNSGIIQSKITNIADELSLLIALIIVLFFIGKDTYHNRIEKFSLVLFMYIIYQVLNYFISPFELNIFLVLAQSLINLKVFIVGLAFILLIQNNLILLQHIQKFYWLLILLFIIGLLSNFIMQSGWNLLLAPEKAIEYRFGFLRPLGWFAGTHYNIYFFTLSFTTLLLLSNKKNLHSTTFVKKFFIFTIIDFLVAFPLTVRKGLFVSIPFGLIALSMISSFKKIIFVFFALIFMGLLLILIQDMEIYTETIKNFQHMTNNDDDNLYIRGLMIYNGVNLFIEFFPFGTGSATFGTVLSEYNTLEVYRYVGLQSHWFEEDGLVGVFDAGLFSMMAENGFVGMLLISIFIYYYFKFNKLRLNTNNYLIFKVITIFTLLLSLTEPVWQNGMYTVFYVVNLLLIYRNNALNVQEIIKDNP